MTFQRIMIYGPDSYPCWICGIYKVVSYDKRVFYAYFIQDHQKTWGDYVETPPARDSVTGNDCWRTLKDAKAACERHAAKYTPKPKTVKRAVERLAEYKEQAAANVALAQIPQRSSDREP